VTTVLVLANGMVFKGRSFGARTEAFGEVCFNTSMSGYQEILTDPSYQGQIIALTYPMVGSYGVNEMFNQSDRPQGAGLIVKQYVRRPSSHTAQATLAEYMIDRGVPGIEGIDTRKLVLTLRSEGAMNGGIFQGDYNPAMLEKVLSLPSMEGLDLANVVSTKQPYTFGDASNKRYRIAVIDLGVKKAILQQLNQAGFAVHVFPANTRIDQLKDFDCYFLSNGPGDPEVLDIPIETTKALLDSGKPLFGICLGHQVLGLARGWKTYKLKFGHRGANQPVQNIKSKRVEITAQNHGFAVDADGAGGLEVSHTNLNDQTVEGFRSLHGPVISVQHHPEANPGPRDSQYMFSDFYKLVDEWYGEKLK